MGTRHLIIVYYKGKYRIAQYGQWDGYPSGKQIEMVIRSTPYIDAQAGQGVTVLAFISQPDDIAKLKIALDTEGHVFELTEEEQQQQHSGSEVSWAPQRAATCHRFSCFES